MRAILVFGLKRNLNFMNRNRKKGRNANVSTAMGADTGILIASSNLLMNANRTAKTIRGILEERGVIEKSVIINGQEAVQSASFMPMGVKVPDDFADWKNYLDVYYYNPMVGTAVDLKQSLIWQMGYTLEGAEPDVRKVEAYLESIDADKSLRDDSFWALIFGNSYWSIRNIKENGMPIALDPMKMGITPTQDGTSIKEYVYFPNNQPVVKFQPSEILHLRYNAKPWGFFGTAPFKKLYATAKIVMEIESDLPTIVKRRADPPVVFQIGEPSGANMVSDEEYKRVESELKNRKAGEDIYHDGILKISEVYTSRGTNQTVEPIISHFIVNLIAGLSVPEIALGQGGTTTMATAEYQERILDAEIRAYQRALKRFHEQFIFPLAGIRPHSVKLNWNPMSPEDKAEVSKQLMSEIEHSVISPSYARARLGYPEEAGEGAVMSMTLQPANLLGKQGQGQDKEKPDLDTALKKAQLEYLKSKGGKGAGNRG